MLPVRTNKDRDNFGPGPVLTVPEHSSVFNIVLHAIYDTPCTQHHPSFDTLVEVISALITYGITPKNAITPSTPLHDILLTHAASRPLELFALASQHDLEDLAIATSPYLLSFSLSTISDEMAKQMGPIYLKRLFFMHLGRAEVLRSILLPPPYPHNPTAACGYGQQKNLTRAWTLAAAYLAWDARAGALEDVIYIVFYTQRMNLIRPFNQRNPFRPCTLGRPSVMRTMSGSTERAYKILDPALVHNKGAVAVSILQRSIHPWL